MEGEHLLTGWINADSGMGLECKTAAETRTAVLQIYSPQVSVRSFS